MYRFLICIEMLLYFVSCFDDMDNFCDANVYIYIMHICTLVCIVCVILSI